jgi:pimeloyl-ACP methyl ester carboxylesterase
LESIGREWGFHAACAYKIPNRLTTCGIISGLGPIDLEVEEKIKSIRRLSFVIRRMPWLFKLMISFQSRGLKDLEKAERKMRETIKKFPESDREVMEDPKLLPLFIKESAEAFRQGNKGAFYEGKLYAKPWGFSPEDISPKLEVYIWHGEVDEAVPVAMGRAMCKAIPNCEGKFYPNDGHYSTIFKYFKEIVSTLSS